MIQYHDVVNLIDEKPEVFAGLRGPVVREYKEFLRPNMHVLQEFERYAMDLRWNGNRDYYSIYCITENMRWNSYFAENGSEFKLNNNNSSCIARTLMALNPHLKGMFRLRRQW